MEQFLSSTNLQMLWSVIIENNKMSPAQQKNIKKIFKNNLHNFQYKILNNSTTQHFDLLTLNKQYLSEMNTALLSLTSSDSTLLDRKRIEFLPDNMYHHANNNINTDINNNNNNNNINNNNNNINNINTNNNNINNNELNSTLHHVHWPDQDILQNVHELMYKLNDKITKFDDRIKKIEENTEYILDNISIITNQLTVSYPLSSFSQLNSASFQIQSVYSDISPPRNFDHE